MVILCGIKNCDSVKKARNWLEGRGINYQFHDFRSDGLQRERVQQWNRAVGWETLLNRRGTSWRQLPQQTRDDIDESSALALMLENPTLIKRPVLELNDGSVHVGFNAEHYAALFPTK
ncbi:MAG: ArsC family reductase [Chromatiales bacterium]|nr:ArsC family reductase [Chromatiales bacterium]